MLRSSQNVFNKILSLLLNQSASLQMIKANLSADFDQPIFELVLQGKRLRLAV